MKIDDDFIDKLYNEINIAYEFFDNIKNNNVVDFEYIKIRRERIQETKQFSLGRYTDEQYIKISILNDKIDKLNNNEVEKQYIFNEIADRIL
jgi:hypothetical protein